MWEFLKNLWDRFNQINCPKHAAAIAYYTIFSMSPLIIILVMIAGAIYGNDAASGILYSNLEQIFGQQSAMLIESLVVSATRSKGSLISSILSISLMLIGASIVLHALQEALDDIWQVEHPIENSWIIFLHKRILAILMVLIIGIIFLGSIILSSTISYLQVYTYGLTSHWIHFASFLDFGLTYFVNTVIFTSIYKFLPSRKVELYYALVGGVVASVLFLVGKILIGFYITQTGINNSYGVAGSLVIILLWVYYISQIILFGALLSAELSRLYKKKA